jgi:hypothetical protein
MPDAHPLVVVLFGSCLNIPACPNIKVHSPVIPTPRIEPTPTPRTLTPTFHILINPQHLSALPTQHRALIPHNSRPDARLVRFAYVVTADAGVELLAAEVLDGDNVEG